MAPLLFILALDSLYKVINARNKIDGIVLRAGGGSEKITVFSYADDTAVYLRESGDIPRVLEILDGFAQVSDLAINHVKSIVAVIGPRDPDRTFLTSVLERAHQVAQCPEHHVRLHAQLHCVCDKVRREKGTIRTCRGCQRYLHPQCLSIGSPMDDFRCLRCRPALNRMQRTLLSGFCLCRCGEDPPMICCDFCDETPSTFKKIVVMAHVYAREVDDALRDRSKSTEELQVVLRRLVAQILMELMSAEKQNPLLHSLASDVDGASSMWMHGFDVSQLMRVRVLHSLHGGKHDEFQRHMRAARLDVMGPLAAASAESYQRACPLFHDIHFFARG
ncbi:hypothetical protein PsorP6_004718 [Peronosclerospora sorghi]|uniref:Uncharacterized protein n=1 Tax=Peronosclerospora sorghi TaxID=230839 RepID=A0ACC0VSB3_9STRA|nr:hypothetical protein PsorP6_004718 [Peronosclerospora sorghi]